MRRVQVPLPRAPGPARRRARKTTPARAARAAQVKVQIIAQIRQALRHGQPQRAASRSAISSRCATPASRASAKRAFNSVADRRPAGPPTSRTQTAAPPSGTSRRPGPTPRRTARRRVNRPIADQQHRVGVGVVERGADRQRLQLAASAPNRSSSRICTSATLVREPSSSASVRICSDRHAAEQLHAQHRPAAGDAGVGDDRVVGILKKLDRRNQRHVELAGGQAIGQPAGQVEHQLRTEEQL